MIKKNRDLFEIIYCYKRLIPDCVVEGKHKFREIPQSSTNEKI